MTHWFLDLLLSAWMHWTYCSQTRYGKSEFVRKWLVAGIRRRAFGCTVIDPAGTLIDKLLVDIAFMGRADDVILVRFMERKDNGAAPDAVVPTVGFDWMTPSRHPDLLERRNQNELQRDRHKKRMLAR